jgi:hypothetical protein
MTGGYPRAPYACSSFQYTVTLFENGATHIVGTRGQNRLLAQGKLGHSYIVTNPIWRANKRQHGRSFNESVRRTLIPTFNHIAYTDLCHKRLATLNV